MSLNDGHNVTMDGVTGKRKKEEIGIDEILSSAVPDTDGVKKISDRCKNINKKTKKDHKFLKKMNASFPGMVCNIDSFIETKNNSDEYLEEEEEGMTTEMQWRCDSCNDELIYIRKDAQRVCPTCGKSFAYQEMTREDMVRQGYVHQTTYLYKRQNHFKTWLKRTQGKETTFIEDEIIEQVRNEIKKQRIYDLSTISHTKIREILKKLRLNKHYNHCVQITSIITGKSPPQMTNEQESALLQMFDTIQEPFQKIIESEPRQNMLSYSFLIHKFLELMSWDEYLPYFPLLRSVDKIQYQDWIWRKLCDQVGFEYIKSTM